MKRIMLYRIVSLLAMFFITTYIINNGDNFTKQNHIPELELLYDNVWGSIYRAEIKQCDNTPTITGDKSIINPYNASELRWIAISQEMLNCSYRAKLLKNSTTNRFKGKIKYGDTIYIESPYEKINGIWIVHDAKNERYVNSIDFLQTKGDSSLYNNNRNWSGKFKNIKIFSLKNFNYSEL